MNAILSIFDYYKSHPGDNVEQTLSFLSAHSHNYQDLTHQIREISEFLKRLRHQAPFVLSNDGVSIDVIALDQAIKSKKIQQYYQICSEVRAELMRVAKKEDFDTLKALNEYWHTLELSLQKIIKGPH